MADVSIIIPVYNPPPRDLEATLLSIQRLHGDYELEVILVDDESPQRWKIQSPIPIQLISIGHGGPSAARNAGIEKASSPNLLCIDVGDKLQPQFLRRTLPYLRKPSHIVYVNMIWQRLDRRLMLHSWGDYSVSTLLKHNYIPITSLFTREVFDAVRGKNGEGFDTKTCGLEDWLFWIEAGLLGFFGRWIDEFLFIYIEHEGSRNKNALAEQDKILRYMDSKLDRLYDTSLQVKYGLERDCL